MSIFNGATLNGLHTFKDFGLIKVGEFNWGSPEPKRQTVDIPGRDGVLDFSEAATGELKFDNRQVELNFAIRVGPDKVGAVKADLMNTYHGKRIEAIDDEEPDWVYRGLASVSFPSYNGWKLYVTISMDADPYKLAHDDTVITVAPADFKQEVIPLGQGKENQKPNSIWTFGTINNPQLDLTQFDHLRFWWTDKTSLSNASLQMVDGDGNVYSATINGAKSGGIWKRDIDISNISGIDKTRVYRILAQNRPLVHLDGYTLSSATVNVHVERMTVVPIWSASAIMTVLVNGKKFDLPQGVTQNYNIRLRQGENQVSFISDSADETVSIQFRNGRL